MSETVGSSIDMDIHQLFAIHIPEIIAFSFSDQKIDL